MVFQFIISSLSTLNALHHEQLFLIVYSVVYIQTYYKISDSFLFSLDFNIHLGPNAIADSLRLLQHVDSIQVPTEWQSAHSKTWKDISWTKKQFQVVDFFRCCIYITFI